MRPKENENWEAFSARGGTWEEFVDDVMSNYIGKDLWEEMNKEKSAECHAW